VTLSNPEFVFVPQTARVSIKGTLNGMDLTITRTKMLSKGSLTFLLGGEDLTTQSVKDTQAVIDEKLGVGAQVLARTMFHGQHALNGLLDATDSKLKDELSLVVPLSFWQNAVSVSRKKGRDAVKRGAELDGMNTVRAEDLAKVQRRLYDAETSLAVKEATYTETETRLGAELDELRVRGSSAPTADGESLDAIEERLVRATESVEALELRWRSMKQERDTELASSRESLDEASTSLASATARFQSIQREYDSNDIKVSSAKERVHRLEELWEIDLTPGKVEAFAIPATCPTCRRPLSVAGDDHSHHDIQENMQQEIDSALDLLAKAQASLTQIKEELDVADSSRMQAEKRCNLVREENEGKVSYWTKFIDGAESELTNARITQQKASSEFAAEARQMQQSVKVNALDSSLNTERESLRLARIGVDDIRAFVQSGESLLKDIQLQRDEQTSITTVMAGLSDAFGQRGIQTFVMQNAVSLLQSLSQSYLDDLSDGAQGLEMALDAGDRISRRAFVRGGDGEYRERPLSSLSGGQWRRCSLALTLGFADLVARRGKLRPSLCVLDEPLTHLDRSGRADVGRVLRKMLRRTAELGSHESSGFTVSTILIILQDLAAEELEESFDCIDEVIKSKGTSSVLVDERV
jgi:DNA repair exonuclease SbcCD ATPase subunit